MADRSLVLDLLRKELSEHSAHIVGVGGWVIVLVTIARNILIRMYLRSWVIP